MALAAAAVACLVVPFRDVREFRAVDYANTAIGIIVTVLGITSIAFVVAWSVSKLCGKRFFLTVRFLSAWILGEFVGLGLIVDPPVDFSSLFYRLPFWLHFAALMWFELSRKTLILEEAKEVA